jgi:hypothetical protein
MSVGSQVLTKCCVCSAHKYVNLLLTRDGGMLWPSHVHTGVLFVSHLSKHLHQSHHSLQIAITRLCIALASIMKAYQCVAQVNCNKLVSMYVRQPAAFQTWIGTKV